MVLLFAIFSFWTLFGKNAWSRNFQCWFFTVYFWMLFWVFYVVSLICFFHIRNKIHPRENFVWSYANNKTMWKIGVLPCFTVVMTFLLKFVLHSKCGEGVVYICRIRSSNQLKGTKDEGVIYDIHTLFLMQTLQRNPTLHPGSICSWPVPLEARSLFSPVELQASATRDYVKEETLVTVGF